MRSASDRQSPFDAMRAYRRLSRTASARWTYAFRIVTGALAAFVVAVCISGVRNASDVVEARDALNEFTAATSTIGDRSRWQRFDQLWLEADRIGQTPDVFKRLGLNQRERLRTRLERDYYAAAAQLLINPLLASLEQRLSTAPGEVSRRDDLRLYQMIHRRPACQLDAVLFVRRSVELWPSASQANSDPDGGAIAEKHLVLLSKANRLARVPADQLSKWNGAYLAGGRAEGNTGTFDSAYPSIIATRGRPLAQLTDVLGGDSSRVRELLDGFQQTMAGETSVDGAFSLSQFASMVRDVNAWRSPIVDSCLGTVQTAGAQDPDGSTRATERYVADYIERWRRVLKGTRVRDFPLADAPRRLSILAGDRSPLLATLTFVSQNTAPIQEKDSATSSASMGDAIQVLARSFAPVHRVVPAGDQRWTGGWINDTYRKSLLDLRDAAAAFASEPQNVDARRRVRDVAAAAISAVDLLQLPSGSDGVDKLVKDLLKAPFELTRSKVPANNGAEVNSMLAALCRDVAALRSRMGTQSHGSPQEAAAILADVTAIYHPSSGSFLRFANNGYVVRSPSADAWVPGPQATNVPVDPGFLQYLNRLSAVSKALFPNGSTFGFDYFVDVASSPFEMSVMVSNGGALGRMEGTSIHLQWPGPRPEEGFLIRTPGTAVAYAGPQGLFDLAKYNERETGIDRVTVSKARLPGGGIAELQHNGQPARVTLSFRGMPGGLDGFWNSPSCPSRATRQ